MIQFMTILTLILGLANGANVTTFSTTPGIYFEEYGKAQLYSTNWNLVTYYDLDSFNHELILLRDQIAKIEGICNNSTYIYCESGIKNLKIILDEIDQNAEILDPSHKRSRRGLINVVGTLSKTLFGTLDEEDAKHYDSQIQNLKKNEDHLLELLKAQTLIVDKTVNLFNKTMSDIQLEFDTIQNKFDKLSQSLNMISKGVNTSILGLEMENAISTVILSLMRYQNTQRAILDMLLDVKHGIPNPSVINPLQLEHMLAIIRKNLPPDTILPISSTSNKLIDLYRLSQTSTNKINNQILIEIKIPLPLSITFQIYKIIPLPTAINNSFVYIKPTTEYLLVTLNRDKHYPIRAEDLNKCIILPRNLHLCKITHPILNSNAKTNHCEMELLKHTLEVPSSCKVNKLKTTTLWVQLSNPNKWLYSLSNPLTVDNICGNNIETLMLKNSGILEISPTCYIRSDELTLYGHSERSSISNKFYLPSINLTEISPIKITNLHLPKTIMIHNRDHQALFELSKEIKSLENTEETKLTSVTPHDIHHYSFIYILITIVIIYCIIKASKMYLKIKSKSQNKAEDISIEINEPVKSEETKTHKIPLSRISN